MEFQDDWLGTDKTDLTEKKMSRFTLAQRRDVEDACRKSGLGYSFITRIMWLKFCDKMLNYPKELRREPTQEIEQTVSEVVGFIPVVKKQLQYNPRLYGGHSGRI